MSKFCKNCGTSLSDDLTFCPNCGAGTGGADANAGAGGFGAGFGGAVNNLKGNFNNMMSQSEDPSFWSTDGASKWDGGVLETLVAGIVASLMITFTCGIATPWAVCYLWNFIISHALIDGRRLSFDGTGAQLFGNWIKWFLLTVITCGIYSFWVTPRLCHWICKHTHIQ